MGRNRKRVLSGIECACTLLAAHTASAQASKESNGFWEWLQEFGSGWKGLLVLCLVLLAWILRGCIPEVYKARIDYKKFLKEHEEKMERLRQKKKRR